MNRKPSMFEKIADFVTGKGFYLIVLACVAVIGLSGFVLVRSVQRGLTGDSDEPVSGSAQIVVTPAPPATARPQITAEPEPEPKAEAETETKPETKVSADAKSDAASSAANEAARDAQDGPQQRAAKLRQAGLH